MGSGIFYPAASGDDGYIKDTLFFGGTRTWATIGYDVGFPYSAFIKFDNIVIPRGSIIDSAFIQFTALQDKSGNTVKEDIFFNDIDDAVAPTSAAEFNALSVTDEHIDWDDVPAWLDDIAYNTPNIGAALQEVIGRPGFVSGNSVMALIKDGGSSYYATRNFHTFTGTDMPELHVTWSPHEPTVKIASWSNLDAGSNLTFSEDLLTATHA